MLDVQYQLSDVKKTSCNNNDVSFTLDSHNTGKPIYTACNVQPSAIEAMPLTQGVKLVSKGVELNGPKPE